MTVNREGSSSISLAVIWGQEQKWSLEGSNMYHSAIMIKLALYISLMQLMQQSLSHNLALDFQEHYQKASSQLKLSCAFRWVFRNLRNCRKTVLELYFLGYLLIICIFLQVVQPVILFCSCRFVCFTMF